MTNFKLQTNSKSKISITKTVWSFDILVIVICLLFVILYLVLPSQMVFATAMSSESYSVESNVIGPGVINISTSTNYTVEYNPGAQSTYDVSVPASPLPPSPLPSTGGGGGGSTINHINAFNVPLVITEEQSGTLTYNFPDDLDIVIDAPKEITPNGITIIIKAEKKSIANEYLIPPESDLIGKIFWNITAIDSDGAIVSQFDKYITITLKIPNLLVGAKDLGVYWLALNEVEGLDEDAGKWILVPGAVFTGTTIVFNVDHLTKFAIFGRIEIPNELDILIPQEIPETLVIPSFVPPVEVREVDIIKSEEPERIEQLSDIEAIPEQLFDINFEIDDTTITDINELVARVLFTSFGRVPTPIDLTFTILNEAGERVYEVKDYIVVETEEILTKKFEGLKLDFGKYTVILNTLYNTNVTDEFKQDFEIKKESNWLLWIFLWIIIVATIIIIMIIFLKKRKNKRDS